MMKINWMVRIKNKTFWVALVPALLFLVQVAASIFGFTLDFGELGNQILTLINAVFAVLVILGVVNDPTTEGIGDSAAALEYKQPKAKGK